MIDWKCRKMEFIEQVNKEEFEQFVSTNLIKGHFMQSYYWGEVSKNKKFKPHYLGLKETLFLYFPLFPPLSWNERNHLHGQITSLPK